MAGRMLTLNEVAARLDISRPGALKLVERGTLAAERVGRQWLVDANDLERLRRTRLPQGRPMTQAATWARIEAGQLPLDEEDRDRFRRLMRQRARHFDAYIHRSVIPDLLARSDVVAGGRHAAHRLELPIDVGPDDDVQLYVPAETFERLSATPMIQVRSGSVGANAVVHVVDDENWDHLAEVDAVPPVVAWMDLADEDDRAARLVLEYLLRRQPA